MCQPKPGPRCASHARVALANARTGKADAEAAFETTRLALRAEPRAAQPYGRFEPSEASLAYRAASDALIAARADYEAALRDYETTPAGQKDLQAAIDRLTGAGDTEAADAARARLADAQAARARQVADLAESRAQAERLATIPATPEETAAVAPIEHAIGRHTGVIAVADSQLDRLAEQNAPLQEQWQQVRAAHADACRAERAAQDEVVTAQAAARDEARRLYIEAGVSDRYATFYADDTVAAAAFTHTSGSVPGSGTMPEVATRELRLKTKRSGADAERSRAAKAASATDERFQAANAVLAEKIAAHAATKATRLAIEQGDLAQVGQRWRDAETGIARVRSDREAAEHRLAHERGILDRTKALIAVGGGTTSDPKNLDGLTGDEIVRQPDGSTNAYVYRPASPGFPHGRAVRVTGVTTVHGMGAANALVLETGETVHANVSYSMGRSGGRTHRSAPVEVLLTPAQSGARPLRAEGVPAASFTTYIDSTD